jgi:hypothetical protein
MRPQLPRKSKAAFAASWCSPSPNTTTGHYGIVILNLHACECIFDQYHQLEAIITVHAEFTEVRFVRNSFGINT